MASSDPPTLLEKEPVQTNSGGANGDQTHRYGYGAPSGPDGRLAAFAGEFHPSMFKPYEHRKFANPAPLGLSAFGLTTFVLSAINMGARGITAPNITVPLAFAYGGFVQLCAGMW
jgi:hypothetical protein